MINNIWIKIEGEIEIEIEIERWGDRINKQVMKFPRKNQKILYSYF